MIRHFFVVGMLVWGVPAVATAQPSVHERAAIRKLEKHRWEKADLKLRKGLKKLPSNALAKFLLSRYFFFADNPAYNVDSAYHYALESAADFSRDSLLAAQRMQKFHFTLSDIVRLREQIDSTVFEAVRKEGTEAAFIRFLAEHPGAVQRDEAITLRNRAAFMTAEKIGTYQAYASFLNKYPDAEDAPRARVAYDRLLYESKTADGRLSSYESFLKAHPDTPFRPEVLRHIFELSTRSGAPADFANYVAAYPRSPYTKIARDILYHLSSPESSSAVATDSLAMVARLDRGYLVPWMEKGRFGLMDKDGNVVIPTVIPDLDEEYTCGNIVEDIIVLADSVIGRTGAAIYRGSVDEVEDLGTGFLLVRQGSNLDVVHKSGFIAHRGVKDAFVVGNRCLAIFRDDGWRLFGLTGRSLRPESWDEIVAEGNLVMLRTGERWDATTTERLFRSLDGPLETEGPFTKATPLRDGGLLVTSDNDAQGLLDDNLAIRIPLKSHRLERTFFGYVGRSDAGAMLYFGNDEELGPFAETIVREPWVLARKDSLWYIVDAVAKELKRPGYDSLHFEGPFLVAVGNDTATVHFPAGQMRHFAGAVKTTFIPGRDSTAFLRVVFGKENVLYDLGGRALFSSSHDDIQHAGADLFTVSRREKKGLMRADGKLVLPVEYDAIGTLSEGYVSTLQGMKFGLYDHKNGRVIKPQYEKNLRPVASDMLFAYKNGYYGFIGWDNKLQSDFVFGDVQAWNDSSVWVLRGQTWELFGLGARRTHQSGVRSIRIIRDEEEEKLAVVESSEGFGVMSNTRGVIVPSTFSDLVNVGSRELPLYFTEKHVPEASVFVVIYYDRDGRFLRRAIYDDAEQYERIYCPGN